MNILCDYNNTSVQSGIQQVDAECVSLFSSFATVGMTLYTVTEFFNYKPINC